MKNGFPEFVGYWTGSDGDGRSFRMFIDSKEDAGNSTQKISGRMKEEHYGHSTFVGFITASQVKIIKTYTVGHSDISVAGNSVTFKGDLNPRPYHGARHFSGNYWTSKKDIFGRQKTRSIGKFVLERYKPSKTLEFLMRKDRKR